MFPGTRKRKWKHAFASSKYDCTETIVSNSSVKTVRKQQVLINNDLESEGNIKVNSRRFGVMVTPSSRQSE